MPSSNGGRGGYKNKKDNGKDAAMIENVSEKMRSFLLSEFFEHPFSVYWMYYLEGAGNICSENIHWPLASSQMTSLGKTVCCDIFYNIGHIQRILHTS